MPDRLSLHAPLLVNTIGYCAGALAFGIPVCGHGQGTFQNLNFEAASIPPGTQPGTVVSTNSALPGWSASTTLYYNDVSLGGVLIYK